jgi:hypothetical protein
LNFARQPEIDPGGGYDRSTSRIGKAAVIGDVLPGFLENIQWVNARVAMLGICVKRVLNIKLHLVLRHFEKAPFTALILLPADYRNSFFEISRNTLTGYCI